MKKIIGWFKDLFYNLTDYTLILIIIAIVAGVLIWKFNILFNLKFDKESIAVNDHPIVIGSDIGVKDEDSTSSEQTSEDSEETSTDNTLDNTDQDSTSNDNSSTNSNETTSEIEPGTEVSFTIPPGSYTGKIAEIVVQSGLISDKKLFLDRCHELKLDTKLKAGEFSIESGTSLDNIIKIIAK